MLFRSAVLFVHVVWHGATTYSFFMGGKLMIASVIPKKILVAGRVVVVACVALLSIQSYTSASPLRFYWTNGWTSPANSGGGPAGTVNRIDAGGANPTVIATLDGSGGPLFRVTDVELDQTRSSVYWNNWNSGGANASANEAIYRSDLNGNSQVLFTNSTNASTGFASGLHRISVDETNGDVYYSRGVSYANGNGPEVSRVDVNGANYTQLFGSSSQGWFTSGLVVDPANSRVFWGDSGVLNKPPNGAVNVMGTNGSGPTLLVPWGGGNGQGRSLAYDPNVGADGTVFFSAWTTAGGVLNGPQNGGGGIWSYDVFSGVTTQILSDPTTGIPDIEVDPSMQRIYWTDYVRGEIRSSFYDGSNLVTEIAGLSNPFGLALDLQPIPEPTTLALAALGLLGMVGSRRKRA